MDNLHRGSEKELVKSNAGNSDENKDTGVSISPPRLQLKSESKTTDKDKESTVESESAGVSFQFAQADPGPPTIPIRTTNTPFQLKKEESNQGDSEASSSPHQFVNEGADTPSDNAGTGGNGEAIPGKPNNTGLPSQLKSGVENLSGFTLDDVKVHYNSDKPAQLKAHAYAQGTDIHVASGQEKHLPHEAWHVVQQKQGRVNATTQMKGIGVNDDSGLEKEADLMGAKARLPSIGKQQQLKNTISSIHAPAQFHKGVEGIKKLKDDEKKRENSKKLNSLSNMNLKDMVPPTNRDQLSTVGNMEFPDKNTESEPDSENTKADKSKIRKEKVKKANKIFKNMSPSELGDIKTAAISTTKDSLDLGYNDTGAFAGPQTESTMQDNWVKRGDGAVGTLETQNADGSITAAPGALNSTDAQAASIGLDGIEGLFSIYGGIMKFSKFLTEEHNWESLAVGYFDTAEALAGTVVSTMKSARYIEKAKGGSKDQGVIDSISDGLPIVKTIKSALSGIKTAVESVISTYKEYKQNKKIGYKKSTKVMTAGNIAIRLGQVLESSFTVARDFFRIIDSANVPTSLINGIPGVGIAIASVSHIMNAYKGFKAGKMKNEMEDKVALNKDKIGDDMFNLIQEMRGLGLQVDNKEFFHIEMRGAFFTSKPYYRVKQDFFEALKFKVAATKTTNNNTPENLPSPSQINQDGNSEIPAEEQGYDDLDKQFSNQDEVAKVGYHPKPVHQDFFDDVLSENQGGDKLNKFLNILERYEFISKMAEINQKRQVKSWGSVLDNLITIGGNIAMLTGVGAPAGSAIQIAQGAGKAGIGILKAVQGVSRNVRGTSKSSSNKEKQYVNHTKYLFSHIQNLPEFSEETSPQYKEAHKMLKATGVNPNMVYYEDDPSKAFKLVVGAMSTR